MAKIDTVNLKENKVSKHGPIRKYELPLKKRKIFKNRKVKVKYVEGYKTGYKAILLNGKPIISFGKKISNKIKGIKYDKDGNEIKEANRSRILAFLKKRIKKFIKKQARKKGQSALNGMQGVTKVALISIGGAAGITAAVAVPVTLANTIWKADRYITYVDTANRGKVTISKLANDKNGNLVYSVTPSATVNLSGIKQVKKGDYVLHTVEGRTDTDFEKNVYEYTFSMSSSNSNGGKLIIDKNTVSLHKGDIEITPKFQDRDPIDRELFLSTYQLYRHRYYNETVHYVGSQIKNFTATRYPTEGEPTTTHDYNSFADTKIGESRTSYIYPFNTQTIVYPKDVTLDSCIPESATTGFTMESDGTIRFKTLDEVQPTQYSEIAINPHGIVIAKAGGVEGTRIDYSFTFDGDPNILH